MEYLGVDKLWHFGLGFGLCVMCCMSRSVSASTMILIVLAAAFGKEAYDWMFKTPDLIDSMLDIGATIAPLALFIKVHIVRPSDLDLSGSDEPGGEDE